MAMTCKGCCTPTTGVIHCVQRSLQRCGSTTHARPSRNGTSSPMSTRSASIDLPPTAASVTAARQLVRELLTVWDVPHDLDDAGLLVTELVANVVDHVRGETDLTLELSLSDTWLRIAVADGSSIRPVVQELSHDRPRGRGMRMVAAIADRWGAEDHKGGERVWFD